MPTTSYFRANHPAGAKLSALFFFDDSDETATKHAYVQAQAAAISLRGHVSMWRPPLHAGPWDDAQVIGHRRRSILEASLEDSSTPEEIKTSKEELDLFVAAFTERRSPKGKMRSVK